MPRPVVKKTQHTPAPLSFDSKGIIDRRVTRPQTASLSIWTCLPALPSAANKESKNSQRRDYLVDLVSGRGARLLDFERSFRAMRGVGADPDAYLRRFDDKPLLNMPQGEAIGFQFKCYFLRLS